MLADSEYVSLLWQYVIVKEPGIWYQTTQIQETKWMYDLGQIM